MKSLKRSEKIEKNIAKSYGFTDESNKSDSIMVDLAVDGTVFGSFKSGIALAQGRIYAYAGMLTERDYISLNNVNKIECETHKSSTDIYINNTCFVSLLKSQHDEIKLFCKVVNDYINQ